MATELEALENAADLKAAHEALAEVFDVAHASRLRKGINRFAV